MAKKAADLEWHQQTPEDPFWDCDYPVEIELVDDSREQFLNPKEHKAKLKREYADLVRRWRRLPTHIIAN